MIIEEKTMKFEFSEVLDEAKRAAYMITYRGLVEKLYEAKAAIALGTALVEENESDDMEDFWLSRIEELDKKLNKTLDKAKELARSIKEAEEDVD